MEQLKIWMDNIARCTGYIVMVMFLILMTMIIIICLREKYIAKKYRKNTIRVPYNDFQQSRLGYYTEKPAAFIIANDIDDENEIYQYARQLDTKHDVFVVIPDADQKEADKILEIYIKNALDNKAPIKRFIYNIPDGINLRTGYYKERIGEIRLDENLKPVDDGDFREVTYTYYTLYTKKRK